MKGYLGKNEIMRRGHGQISVVLTPPFPQSLLFYLSVESNTSHNYQLMISTMICLYENSLKCPCDQIFWPK